MTVARMTALLKDRGFALEDRAGSIAGRRPDGTSLSLFTWGNDRHAEQQLVPRKYLVICSEAGRWRLPMVQWKFGMPVSEQATRAWEDVCAEFDEVFLPALSWVAKWPVNDRYALSIGIEERAFAPAGLTVRSYRKQVFAVANEHGTFKIHTSNGTLTVTDEAGGETHLALRGMTGWEDLTDALRKATA